MSVFEVCQSALWSLSVQQLHVLGAVANTGCPSLTEAGNVCELPTFGTQAELQVDVERLADAA